MVKLIILLCILATSASVSAKQGPCPSGQIPVVTGAVGNYNKLTIQTDVAARCAQALRTSYETIGILCWPANCSGAFTLKKGKGTCSTTQVEITVVNKDNVYYDISLVNGYGGSASITSPVKVSVNNINALGPGIYPAGCNNCVNRKGSPCPQFTTPCNSSQICNFGGQKLPFNLGE